MSTNPLNYGTPEACKKAVESGIKIKTGCVWVIFADGRKEIKTREEAYYTSIAKVSEILPAYSMAEVWRELPEGFQYEGNWAWLCTTKSRKKDNSTYCAYYLPEDKAVCGSKKHDANPTDALIYLLIWYLKQREVNMDNNLCTENPENIIELYRDLKIRYDTLIGDHAESLRFVDDLKKEISELEIELSDTKEYEKEAIKRAEQAEIKLAIIEKKYSVNFLTGEIFDGTTYEDVLIFKKE